MFMKSQLIFLVLIGCCLNLSAQTQIIPTSEKFFGFCISNRFKVIAKQQTPITLDKIRARLETGYKVVGDSIIDIYEPLIIEEYPYRDDVFLIKAIKKQGRIDFQIDLESGTETVKQELIPLPVKFYIRHHRLGRAEGQKKDGKLAIDNLREAEGIFGRVDYNGLNAGATIVQFQISGIIDGILQPEILNKGGRFTTKTQAFIQKFNSGDIIIVKNLTYKSCFQELSIAPVLIELK